MATKKPAADVIRSEAKSLYEPQYKAMLDQFAAGETSLDTAYSRNVADIKSTLVDTLADTKQSIENSLLKRGMGRSSRAGFELGQGVEKVTSDINKSLENILQDYTNNKMNLQQQRQTAAATFEQGIAAEILKLNQWYDQMQLQYDQLNASRGGGGGGSSSTKNPFDDYSVGTAGYGTPYSPPNSSKKTAVSYSGNSGLIAPASKPLNGWVGNKYYVNGVVKQEKKNYTKPVTISSARSKASNTVGR